MTPSSLTLPDGRVLAYAEYGQPNGIPVFTFHGTPGSHQVRPLEAAQAADAGIRLIAPARPGYSDSDFQPDRTLLDWADDVLAIADQLKIAKFGVMGFSGGGPHALACAYQIPERLTKVALLSGLGPVVLLGEDRTPMTAERRAFKVQQMQADPETWLDGFVNSVSGPDGEQLKAEAAWVLADRLDAFRQGVAGAVYDETLILTKAWGFPLEAIPVLVNLWQGEQDAAAQLEHARFMAAHIPHSAAHFVPDAGHLLPARAYQAIFEWLLG